MSKPGEPVVTRTCTVNLDENGIVRVIAVHADLLRLADAREMIAAVVQAAQGRRVPILVDVRRGAPLTREAREYLVGEEATAGALAVAFVLESPMARVIGGFFLRVQKPRVPSGLFISEEEALSWLKGFLGSQRVRAPGVLSDPGCHR